MDVADEVMYEGEIGVVTRVVPVGAKQDHMYVNIWLYNRMAFVPVTEVIPTGKRYEQIIGIIDALKKNKTKE